MAQFNFNATQYVPNPGDVEPAEIARAGESDTPVIKSTKKSKTKLPSDKVEATVSATGQVEEKRERGRPRTEQTRIRETLEAGYKADYATYLDSCGKRKDQLAAAQATLNAAIQERRKLLDAWDAYVANLRATVLRIKAQDRPAAPVKPLF